MHITHTILQELMCLSVCPCTAGEGAGVSVNVQAGEICVRDVAAAAAGGAAALHPRQAEADEAHGRVPGLLRGGRCHPGDYHILSHVCFSIAFAYEGSGVRMLNAILVNASMANAS